MVNPFASDPNFDLNAKNVHSENEPVIITHSTIVSLQQASTTTHHTKDNTMIWLLIAAAVLLLAFFTWKLISDMNKAKA